MTTKTTKTRRRVEKRYRKERIATIVSAIILCAITSACSYIFWYNYIPSDINAADGQVKVHVKYKVTSGDTLDGIAARYYKNHGYDRPCSFENEVIHINNLQGRIDYLQVGQILELPKIVNAEVYEPYRIE